jgi:hypothetical protein
MDRDLSVDPMVLLYATMHVLARPDTDATPVVRAVAAHGQHLPYMIRRALRGHIDAAGLGDEPSWREAWLAVAVTYIGRARR